MTVIIGKVRQVDSSQRNFSLGTGLYLPLTFVHPKARVYLSPALVRHLFAGQQRPLNIRRHTHFNIEAFPLPL